MKEKCFDIGTIQAFLDGELAPDFSESVASHVSICDACAAALAEAEEEAAFAFAVLEQEFNNELVPTHRLWTKINDSIEKERKPFWKTAFAFVANLRGVSLQTVAAFASAAFVFALFASLLFLQNDGGVQETAVVNSSGKQIEAAQNTVSKSSAETQNTETKIQNPAQLVAAKESNKKEFQVVKATFAVKENKSLTVADNSGNAKIVKRNSVSEAAPTAKGESLAGEESYIKTIATLSETVNTRKDVILKPSARFAFEKNLAVVNDAIEKMRAEVKKNPKNEGAKQVLLASYQNKIDLLNSVAEKNELMASLR